MESAEHNAPLLFLANFINAAQEPTFRAYRHNLADEATEAYELVGEATGNAEILPGQPIAKVLPADPKYLTEGPWTKKLAAKRASTKKRK